MSVQLINGSAALIGSGGPILVREEAIPLPNQMAAPGITNGSGQVIVDLDDAVGLNGGTWLQWDVRYSTDEATWTTIVVFVDPYTLPLTNGVSYYIQTRAVTTGGIGPWSVSSIGAPVAVPPTITVPGAMIAPFLIPGDGQVTVDLGEGTPNGGAAISSEDIRYSTNQTTWTQINGVTDPYVITGRANGTTLYVQTRARNSQGAGDWSPSASATPFGGTVEEPAADVTVSGNSAASSQLAAWNASWQSTIPIGKTSTSPRYLDLEDGEYGVLSLTPYKNFPAMVHIRSKNRATLGARVTQITGTGIKNIAIQYIYGHLDGAPAGQDFNIILFTGATDCRVEYCAFVGPNMHLSGINTAPLKAENCLRFEANECYYEHFIKGMRLLGCTDSGMNGNMCNLQHGDDITYGPAGGSLTNNWMTRHWFSREKAFLDPPGPTADHVDLFQNQASIVNGIRVWGNISLMRYNTGLGVQGLYMGNCDSGSDVHVEQNAMTCTNQGIKMQMPNGAPGDPDKIVRSNATLIAFDAIWITRQGAHPTPQSQITFSLLVSNPNRDPFPAPNDIEVGIHERNVDYSQSANKSQAGTDGVAIIGPGMPDSSAYAEILALYRGPFLCDSPSWISSWYPVPGGEASWAYTAGPIVGPSERLYEVFVLGIHPGNSKNRFLAAKWQATWNGDGFVTV